MEMDSLSSSSATANPTRSLQNNPASTATSDPLSSDHQHSSSNPTLEAIPAVDNAAAAHDLKQQKPLGKEKGKMHWEDVSLGIPETWGKEGFLKDWIEYSTFDALLAPKDAAVAREALVAEARKPHQPPNNSQHRLC